MHLPTTVMLTALLYCDPDSHQKTADYFGNLLILHVDPSISPQREQFDKRPVSFNLSLH